MSRRNFPGRLAWALASLALLGALLVGCGASPNGAGEGPTATSNPAPTATATPPGVRYVALGASDAVGVGASDPNHTAYVPILISRLPQGANALNLGINGETLHGALAAELPQAIEAQPTLITVWLVGNDFKTCVPLAQYTADLNTLLTQLQTKTHAKVFVANAPDFSLLPAVQQTAAAGVFCGKSATQAAIRAETITWNQAIGAAVAAHHDTLVNVYEGNLAGHPDYISSDGFHPSDAGYLALANLFWSAITAHKAA
ncbi:MAG TPA: GDSL-type esterase/lipase family protein [Ktedonobacterales bacterium]|nr:GDSL-type esterase/lipase family protein [Ktedonobacterales bacterium]